MNKRLEADWLTKASTLAVLSAFEPFKPGSIRFVGGCVRNTIMNRSVDDIDIATQLSPDETLAALEAANVRAIPTGIEHGTITAVIDGEAFEITSLRKDVETDGRRAVVSFTQDWATDAERRDFRLNALYAAPDGEVFDPTGGGYDDALAGRVIFIGDADTRLREDYLRILRFFRFNAWYGAEIDAAGLAACTRQKQGLAKIARERIWKEVRKMFASDQVEALRTSTHSLVSSGVMAELLPGATDLDGLDRVLMTEEGGAPHDDPIRRLLGLYKANAGEAVEMIEALRLSNTEAERVRSWASDEVQALALNSRKSLHEALYWHGKEAVLDRAATLQITSMYFYSDLCKWQRPEFPLNGDDALAVGLKGPEIGIVLGRLEQFWVENEFKPDREALLARLDP